MSAEKQWGPYQLTEDYRVAADSYSYTLYKKRISKKGKSKGETVWRAITHHGTVHQLLNKLLNLQIAENLGDLGKAIERMEEVEKNLKNLIKIKKEREKSWVS